MTKKAVILIIVFVLLLGVGGVFWLLGSKNESLIEEVKFESPKNFLIKDTAEGKIVENRNAGLSFKVPEGWIAEIKEYDKGEGGIELFSPDVSFYSNSKLQKKGCGVAVNIEYRYNEEEIQLVKDLIKGIQENPDMGSNKYKEVIEVDQHKALKQITFNNAAMGRGVSVQIPDTDKIYIFSTFFPSEEERCEKEFDKFLETLSID